MRPKKSLSQFFLRSKYYLKKISDSLKLESQDIILEIGAGRGELTSFLIEKKKEIFCVEIDKELCRILKDEFKDMSFVKIFCEDIRKFNLEEKNIVAVGNVPYHLSFEIIEFLIKNRGKIKKAYLTLQKEFAQKLTASLGTKDYGFLNCFTNLYSDTKVFFNIPKNYFYPQPKVDASFVEFRIYPQAKFPVKNEESFFKFLKKVFAQRRKKIINILKKIYPHKNMEESLKRCLIPPQLRPENISLPQFISLYDSIFWIFPKNQP